MAETEHGRIIAQAAKAILRPIGFRRKGLSRVWFSDEGFWVNIVEFQSSAWARGCYLNSGIEWPWDPSIVYDRLADFIEFDTIERFAFLTIEMAEQGAAAAQRNRSRFKTIPQAVDALIADLESEAPPWHVSRTDAGILAGLIGRLEIAETYLRSATEFGMD
ncbi:DUF4304 domain-containing protein [Acuticoccus sp. I52.16.1]|uniref:DUF4304 domain-containing protein n=1 Tax=Acuticoccus sp. I52.16.1 TaxID=2928472 RepID=UPI001FD34580|nr:DUF4304 domain-containing protein [Acuticoccus sp. I52.16.1]UOM34021.1 DUF4304 domain-containing protein [Acuticoccus sp. I52.16.1]